MRDLAQHLNRAGRFVAAALFVVVAACDTVAPIPIPPERPIINAPTPSEASQELSKYYKRVENGLVAQGLLRMDGGGPDVPFTSRNLVDNFVRIALFEEYTRIDGRLVARQTPSQVHKWTKPISMKVEFGASIPADQQIKDSADINKFAKRLTRLTGLGISTGAGQANYHVFVVNEDERADIIPRIKQIMPGVDQAAIDAVQNMPRSTYCLVFASDPQNSGKYQTAIAVIRGEHSDLMRLSCIHEELTQGLGLSNDSPSARPSIFNDDEEFGLLTTHDEMLLRMLYDPRIIAGMSAGEARTQAEIIASELLGGES